MCNLFLFMSDHIKILIKSKIFKFLSFFCLILIFFFIFYFSSLLHFAHFAISFSFHFYKYIFMERLRFSKYFKLKRISLLSISLCCNCFLIYVEKFILIFLDKLSSLRTQIKILLLFRIHFIILSSFF